MAVALLRGIADGADGSVGFMDKMLFKGPKIGMEVYDRIAKVFDVSGGLYSCLKKPYKDI